MLSWPSASRASALAAASFHRPSSYGHTDPNVWGRPMRYEEMLKDGGWKVGAPERQKLVGLLGDLHGRGHA